MNKLLFLFFFFSKNVYSKEIQSLKKEKEKIFQKVLDSRKELKKYEEDYKKILDQIFFIKNQIENQNKLIEKINQELIFIENEIIKKKKQIGIIEIDQKFIKKRYENIVYELYKKTRKLDNIFYILFFENSLYTYLKKIKAIKECSKVTKIEIDNLKKVKENLYKEKKIKEVFKKKKETLLEDLKKEINNLKILKDKNFFLVKKLKYNQEKIKENIKNYNDRIYKLDCLIKNIIEKNIKKIKQKKIYKKIKKNEKIIIEDKVDNFYEDNRNKDFIKEKKKMIWPVEKNSINVKFGISNHPNFPNIKIDNLGINIKVEKTQNIKAVFDGTVTSCLEIEGMQIAIIVEHIDFYTVYIMLNKSYVKPGDKVSKNQDIGVVEVKKNESSEIQFQIWYKKTKLNPLDWLK